jgi:hypothetical protein
MNPFALFAAICAVALSAGATKTGNAATITETDNFTASGFTPSGGRAAPGWTGSFTITFDPLGGPQSGALDAFSSNLPAFYGPFTYLFRSGQGTLDIGDACAPHACIATPGDNQAFVEFSPVTASGSLTFLDADITQNNAITFQTFTGTVTPTPLPAALPLFAAGLGASGLFGWLRKRKSRAAVAA